MRYILILLLFISGAASAQFAPTSAKSKFVNGIAIGSKDTSAFSAADTMVLTIARDSVMYYKYRGVWRPIATGGNLNNYKLISDTFFTNGYTTRARTKQGLDSLGVLKLNISDTAAMLANRLKISDTLTMLSKLSLDRVLANGNTSGRGVVLGTGSFTSSGSSSTVEIAHSSGSGIALNITKGGNGEGLYINKTSGTANAATIIGTLNATTLVKSGGTSSQFLMADGSVNTSVLPSGAYLPLSGGTLTGALNGTSAAFSGAVNSNSIVVKNSGVPAAQFYRDLDVTVVGSAGQGIEFGARNGASTYVAGAAIYGGLDNPATTGNLTFQTLTSGTLTTKMFINSNGNVGIGTTTPGAKFHVAVGYGLLNNAYSWAVYNTSSNGFAAQFGAADDVAFANTGNNAIISAAGSNAILFGTNSAERMRISSGGNTLIKTSTDNGTDALQVAGSVLSTTNLGLKNTNSSQSGVLLDYTGTGAVKVSVSTYNNTFAIYDETNARNIISQNTSTQALSFTGASTFSSTVSATGFIVSSDRRLKNIVSRSGDMVTYTLKADKDKILHYGYIAQEVEKTLPTTVSTDDKGMKAVNYIEVLVKKVNDLEKKIEQLEKLLNK